MKKLVLSLLALAVASAAFSQNKTWLGLTFGFGHDQFQHNDPGGHLVDVRMVGPNPGMLLERELGPHFSMGSGVLTRSFRQGVGMDEGLANWGEGEAFTALQVPLRAKFRQKFWKEQAQVYGQAGPHLFINLFKDRSPDGMTFDFSSLPIPILFLREGEEELSYTYENTGRTFFLLETGAGIEFFAGPRFSVGLGASYYFGFAKIVEMDIEYSNVAGEEFTAKSHSTGNSLVLSYTLRYAIVK